jgi:hypothetical protein
MKVIGEESTAQGKGMGMKEALEEAGMVLEKVDELVIVDTGGKEYPIRESELKDSFLIPTDSGADASIGDILVKDVQKISKTR